VPGLMGVLAASFGRIALATKDQPVAAHAHPHIHLLFKVDGADRAFDVAGTACQLEDGRAVAVNPWQLHGEPGPILGPTTILTIYAKLDWMARRFAGVQTNRLDCPWPVVTPDMRAIIDDLVERMTANESGGADGIEESVARLVGAVLAQRKTETMPANGGRSDFRIKRAIDIIRADPAQPRNLAQLAFSVGLSRSRFFDQFQQVTGVSPRLYANAIWLERAVDALLIDERPIGEVSDRLGFATHSHFCRFFRERVGFTPREYKAAAIGSIQRESAPTMSEMLPTPSRSSKFANSAVIRRTTPGPS
jgi:AraC family transcriptional regulator